MRFYPYDFQYKVKEGKVYVYLYSKDESGKKICIVQEHPPFFYASVNGINTEELAKQLSGLTVDDKQGFQPAKVLSWEEVEKELIGKNETFWKIYVNYPKAVPLIAKELQERGLATYEKDILFIHRYLRDIGIIPMTLCEAEGELIDSNLKIPVFRAKEIRQVSDKTTNWNILALDIETYAKNKEINPQINPILMIAFYGMKDGEKFKRVITWKEFKNGVDYLEVVKDEKELLERTKDIIADFSPDILTGYFSDGFDLPYIKTRAEKLGVKLNIGLDGSELETRNKVSFRDGEAKIAGIMHLDVLKFIKNIFWGNLKTDTYTLDAVAGELLGHNKHEVDLNKLADHWDNGSDELENFVKYNLQDSRLTYRLLEKLLPAIYEFTTIVGLPAYDVIRMRFSRLVESYILRRAREFNVIAPNKPGGTEMEQRMQESVQGAFVFEPEPGLYQDVVVFDFRSLYPTIITAHNLGPEALQCKCCKGKTNVPGKEEYWFCEKKKFLPGVLEDLIIRRTDLKKEIKKLQSVGADTKFEEARSYTLKILANSFYGYLGFFGARWYCIECAAATTAYARDYIKKAIAKAEERGFKVIYADTDSCFLLLGDKKLDEALLFMEEVNFKLPGQMELEYEGYFQRGIFVALKGSDKGAKKKYALIDKEGKMKITGFEVVRRNWSSLAKEVQEKVLRLVLTGEEDKVLDYVRKIVKELQAGKVDLKKLVIRTQITRELSQYKSVGPHVLVARRMVERGDIVNPGLVIEYVITKGKGLVRERAKLLVEAKDYDADYYINNQILPAVSSIMAVLGYSEEELASDEKQTGLGSFFG